MLVVPKRHWASLADVPAPLSGEDRAVWDELFETVVLSKLGRYEGRILVLNLDGFYDPLRALLEHFVREGMTARTDVDRVVFCDSTDALAALL